MGWGRRYRPASQSTPACDPEGSALEGRQDYCVQDLNSTPGSRAEVARVWSKVLLTTTLCSHQGDDRRCTKSGTWFLKTALILATSPVLPHVQSWLCALRLARASLSLGLNTGGHPRGGAGRPEVHSIPGGLETPLPLPNLSYTFPHPFPSFQSTLHYSPSPVPATQVPTKPDHTATPSTPASRPATPFTLEDVGMPAALFSFLS